MAIKQVLKMGHPLLNRQADAISEFNTPLLKTLLTDMRDTMAALDGAGLAAPQIGVSLQVVIFGLEFNARYPDAEPVPQTVLINPTITAQSQQMAEDWEGCLSVPGMRGLVPRFTHIKYTGYTETGEWFDREVKDFHARVVQHEVDHLNGILYPQRMKDLQALGFEQDTFPPLKE